MTALILFVGIVALAVTGALMGITQADIGYGSVWMNSDMGAAVGQALLLGLVTYLVRYCRVPACTCMYLYWYMYCGAVARELMHARHVA